ncbi:MAG: 6-carboxytetrahydropterin synthase QueD [Bacteroidales bacterium]|nr:6-carboxytetrahydropterin synthase QueD [Bacteroidales bacterium]
MYYVSKRLEISSAHSLNLSYESKCEALHGHNWIVVVHCKSKTLNADGMVADFTTIKKKISGALDHRNLNEVFDFNPTAENIAKWICDQIENCYKVEIWESESNKAAYEKD